MWWNFALLYFIVLAVALLLWILCTSLYTHYQRFVLFQQAADRAFAQKRELIVIGDPKKGLACKVFGQAYGYGSYAVDIRPVDDRCYAKDATEFLQKFQGSSCVIFISCVLEYVDNITELVYEINRVAGSNKNVFVVRVPQYSPQAFFYKFQGDESKHIITAAPPYQDYWSWIDLDTLKTTFYDKDNRIFSF